ncbi:hypothetical protein B0H14DRAFT_3476833 [Mycena olivaceomarginata]|nr:hypothetical protein B0H14DRAFT_3476833 [Mycena olivaceomarginata]
MSLHGLRAFAVHYHKLAFLTITYDVSIAPPSDDPSETVVAQLSLIALDVDTSPMTDPSLVAKFLSALFPNLAQIYTLRDWLWEDYFGRRMVGISM